MKRRILSLLFAAVLAVSLLPVTAGAVTTIDTVEIINVAEPLDGNATYLGATINSSGCSLYSVEWFNVTDDAFMNIGDKFEAGKIYQVNLWIESDSGYEFSYINSYTPNVTATINGKTADAHKAYEYNAWAMVVVSYTFEPCPKREYSHVDITMDPVVENGYVPFQILSASENVVADPNFHTSFYPYGITWSDGYNQEVESGARFKGGRDYYVSIAIKPYFSSFTFTEDFSATINGKEATIKQLGKTYALLEANFTCYGSISYNDIMPVTSLPVGGSAPDYDVAYYSPQCKHIDHGTITGWYDVQTGEKMLITDRFETGKQYRVEITLMAEYAYKFARDENGQMANLPYITGVPVDRYSFGYDNYRGRELIYLEKTFRASPSEDEKAEFNGLVEAGGTWGYYKDGVLQENYTGLVPYGDLIFYVENGILDFKYTGLVWHNDAWTYVANSQLTEGYTGLVWFNNEWFYVVDSVIDWTFTGLVPYEGNMFYVQNNRLDWGYTGLAYLNNGWYYVENALLKPDFTGLTYFNDNWFYVVDGVVDWTYTGLAEYNGNSFYVQNNLLDWSYTGLGYVDGGWYYFQNALYTPSFSGLVPFNGSLFYVKNGTIDWSYTGKAEYNGVEYDVKNGAVEL